jgi:predicted phage terminase large subunit-like protein
MTSPAEAAAALLRRRGIRRDLLAWSEHALAPAGLRPAAHHRLLISKLQAIADGTAEKRKLMVLMPPGSAKTTYGSYLFPPWMMTRPDFKVLAASHSNDRASYVSGHAQRFLRDNQLMLGVDLAKEAVGNWWATNGAEYRAAGVLEGIAGTRCDLGLIDDPVKSREVADSEVQQEKIWDWYWSDFFNRLRPGASQVLIMTRWAEGDLGGRLEEAEGDEWDIVRLPAVAEANDPLGRAPGEMLWDDDDYGFGAKLKDDRVAYARAGRARDWSAMYQQRPSPETGDYFRREWLRPVQSLPPLPSLRVYGASDYAVTADGGDWTVHVVVGMDPDGRLWLLDLWRGQAASDAWVEAFCDLVIQWKPIGWAEEQGQIRAGVGPFLDRRMRERRAFVARHQFPTRGDKSVRAQSIRGRMALDGLHLRADAPWRATLEAELMGFPAGKHDDQVDALGLAGQLLDIMAPGSKPKDGLAPEKPWWEKRRGPPTGWKVA